MELNNRMQSLSDPDFVKYYIQLAKFVVPIQKSIDIKEPVEDKVFEIDVLDGKGEVTDTYVSVFKGEQILKKQYICLILSLINIK